MSFQKIIISAIDAYVQDLTKRQKKNRKCRQTSASLECRMSCYFREKNKPATMLRSQFSSKSGILMELLVSTGRFGNYLGAYLYIYIYAYICIYKCRYSVIICSSSILGKDEGHRLRLGVSLGRYWLQEESRGRGLILMPTGAPCVPQALLRASFPAAFVWDTTRSNCARLTLEFWDFCPRASTNRPDSLPHVSYCFILEEYLCVCARVWESMCR